MPSKVLKSDLLLLLTAAIWGGGFVAQRIGMQSVEPLTFNAVRFALGALSLVPMMILRHKRGERPMRSGQAASRHALLLNGGSAGLALFLGATFQQMGIVHTTAGKAGFITGFYVVLVPILGLLWKQRPDTATWLGALTALVGLYFLSVTEDFTLAKGDALELMGAFCWAAHVLLIGWSSRRVDPLLLSLMQFAVCSLLSLLGALWTETIALDKLIQATPAILYSGLISVGVAYTLQVVAQKDTPPAHASIILTLESVFAAFYGGLLLGEQLSSRALLGCLLMLFGMVLSQLHFFLVWYKQSRALQVS